jgi:polyhydroxyalkanoate synthesis regulator phasin
MEELEKGFARCAQVDSVLNASIGTEAILVVKYESYLKTSQPFTVLTGAMQVIGKKTRDKQERFLTTLEAYDQAYVDSVNLVLGGAIKGVELLKRGNMSDESLKQVSAEIIKTAKAVDQYMANSERDKAAKSAELQRMIGDLQGIKNTLTNFAEGFTDSLKEGQSEFGNPGMSYGSRRLGK